MCDGEDILRMVQLASYMTKAFPESPCQHGVLSLKHLSLKKLTQQQKTKIVSDYSNQYPEITEKILLPIKMDYERVLFNIVWVRVAIRKNTVSSLISKFPNIFVYKTK